MIYSGDFGDLLDFVSGAKQYSFGPMGLDLFGSQLGKGHDAKLFGASQAAKAIIVRRSPFFPRWAVAPFRTIEPLPAGAGIR